MTKDEGLISRGPPTKKKQTIGSFKENRKYDAILETQISKKYLEKWISIIIAMGIRIYKSREDYFDWNSEHEGSDFVYSVMSPKLFDHISNNIDFDIDYVQNCFNESLQSIYKPQSILSADETMAPSKSKNNPHHMFLPMKPHPNGTLFTSVADQKKMILAYNIRRRTEEDWQPLLQRYKEEIEFVRIDHLKSKSKKTSQMIKNLYIYPAGKHYIILIYKGSTVVVDSLYGSLDLFEQFLKNGVHMVCKCRSNRPSFIFKDFLHKIIEKTDKTIGTSVSCSGNIQTKEGHVKFSAYTILTQTRNGHIIKNNFLSSIHEAGEQILESRHFEVVEMKDGTKISYCQCKFNQSSVISYYNHCAGYIDETNHSILTCFPQVVFHRWKLPVFFLFLFSWIHNARILYNDFTGKDITLKDFRKQLSDELANLPSKGDYRHTLSRTVKEKSKRRRCKVCEMKNTDKKTYTKCMACNAFMCQSCFRSDGHYQFIESNEFKKTTKKSKR